MARCRDRLGCAPDRLRCAPDRLRCGRLLQSTRVHLKAVTAVGQYQAHYASVRSEGTMPNSIRISRRHRRSTARDKCEGVQLVAASHAAERLIADGRAPVVGAPPRRVPNAIFANLCDFLAALHCAPLQQLRELRNALNREHDEATIGELHSKHSVVHYKAQLYHAACTHRHREGPL